VSSGFVALRPRVRRKFSAVAERKRAACYAHASQTPDRFYQLQETVTRMRGIERGTSQAEGFIRHVQSPDFAMPLIS